MVVAGISVAVLILIAIASRRFEGRQRRLGRWDEYGPLEESEAPDSGRYGGYMNWHMETLGLLKARVRRRRRPHEPPER